MANTPINSYRGAIQIGKEYCNTQYRKLNKKEEINISISIKKTVIKSLSTLE